MELEMSAEEAGLYLSLRVAFGDERITADESRVFTHYYQDIAIDPLLAKVDSLPTLEDGDARAIEVLRLTDTATRLRALAVGAKVAKADGVIHANEVSILSKFANALNVSTEDVQRYYTRNLTD